MAMCRAAALCGASPRPQWRSMPQLSTLPSSLRCARLSRPLDDVILVRPLRPLAFLLTCSTILGMPQKRRFRAVAEIDPKKLAEFQAGIRKRYSDEQILAELRACAERLGRSPTMREFAADAETSVHPQTVIEHYGSWNAAKRAAGLVPRRFATREELLGLLAELGRSSGGRRPRATSTSTRASCRPSRSTGTRSARSRMRCARPASTCRWGRSGWSGRWSREPCSPARSAGCRSSRTGPRRARRTTTLLTEWQVYRMLDARRGAWSTFQFLVRERLDEQGVRVSTDGRPRGRRAQRREAAARQERPSCGARTAGSATGSVYSRSGRKRSSRTTRRRESARNVPP